MAQQGNIKTPARMVGFGGDSPASTGTINSDKPRGGGLGEFNFDRRSFLGKVVGGIGAAVAVSSLYPVMKFIIPPENVIQEVEELVVGKAADVPDKNGKIFAFNSDKVIIVNDNGKLTACSAVCTHMGCLVHWDAKENQIACPCHGAKYQQTGEIISGPQPLPLRVYKAKVVGDDLIIAKA